MSLLLMQGYRVLTGQSRESMMGLVGSMGRNAVIVLATTIALAGSELHSNCY